MVEVSRKFFESDFNLKKIKQYFEDLNWPNTNNLFDPNLKYETIGYYGINNNFYEDMMTFINVEAMPSEED